jgi:TPR repeat protein
VAVAQYDLGTLYATGTGTEPNAFEAARWIGKAAAAGHPEAALEFGVILFRGHGVPVDEKRGVEMFRSAAEKGLASAQDRLARCYVYGAGVEKNLVQGAKWYLLAKAGGIEDAGLEKVLSQLSNADRSKAQKAASEWRDRAQAGIE